MRHVILQVFAGASILAALAAGCTAAGSSTVVEQPSGSGQPDSGIAINDEGGSSADGSSGTTDYAALFGPPASTASTPDSLNGLWAGGSSGMADLRLVFSNGAIIMAQRCGTETVVGMSVTARNGATAIAVLESKSARATQSSSCRLDVKPLEVPRCAGMTAAEANNEGVTGGGCFFLSGSTLNFYGTIGFLYDGKLTKLSD